MTQWPMEPGAPDDPLTLEELLDRPAWHAPGRLSGPGAGEWVKAAGAGDYTEKRAVCAGCAVRSASTGTCRQGPRWDVGRNDGTGAARDAEGGGVKRRPSSSVRAWKTVRNDG
jgi:hypothetical protein